MTDRQRRRSKRIPMLAKEPMWLIRKQKLADGSVREWKEPVLMPAIIMDTKEDEDEEPKRPA